ncbi:peptidoglycan bridge formation glycyltransferase FemA/FemB family protein [Candidatus Gracilibacteria bacterium]|nr:peptidoglycan bridge formation glycyltransferase FemA/FemB family protein [Candidatus Gracilibacteria bacterium]
MHTNSFFLSEEFSQLQESLAYRGKIYRIEVAGVRALVVRMKRRFGLRWLWVLAEGTNDKGWGDMDMEFAHELYKIAKKEKAIYARVEPVNNVMSEFWPGLKRATKRYTPDCTLVVDLSLSETEILSQMKPKGRYNIKIAQKHGVEVKRFDEFEKIPAADFEAFYTILRTTGERDGFGINPKFYYEQLLKIFGAKKKSSLFLAYHNEHVLGGIIVVYEGKTATYYYGASSNESRNTMANYALQWEAMRHAKTRGMTSYDFLGIAPNDEPNHPWQGITDFKKKFGGTEKKYPAAIQIVYRPFLHTLTRLSR